MPEIVYLMRDLNALRFSPSVNKFSRDRIDSSESFSQIERNIAREYGQYLNVTHLLLDVKFPLIREFYFRNGERRRDLPRDDPDWINLPYWGGGTYDERLKLTVFDEIDRYRTIILCEDRTKGNILGYSAKIDRAEKLAKMVRVYIGRGEYEGRGFKPPFFALTSEPITELKTAFENGGLEVKLVNLIEWPPTAINSSHLDSTGAQTEIRDVTQSSYQNPIFDGLQARVIRQQERLTQTDLAKLLGVSQAAISSFEKGTRKPSFTTRSKFVNQYLTWLKEHGYDPYRIK
ncbi:helix-turn-helix transcriptional regulator [Candidatus Woesearchaeota archaeon]|nr:helix-turn-helix transcriptional regulator [Candidatus Woesearchaeota archaeon]